MKKCQAPDHPHCTQWVMDGEAACRSGHVQLEQLDGRRQELLNLSASSLTQVMKPQAAVASPASVLATTLASTLTTAHAALSGLHLHFSGYDPRAAGGRQTIRLELCGNLPPDIKLIKVQLRSDLLAAGDNQQRLLRAASGQWQPLLLSFTSKNKEHGQYPLEVILSYEQDGQARRKWTCTSVIFVPRSDISLTEINSVFLAAQKNIKLMAEDGAIATLSGFAQSHAATPGNTNIEINAKDAAIATMDMQPPSGKYEIALGNIAWDEELIEIEAKPASVVAKPEPMSCLTSIQTGLDRKNPVIAKPTAKAAIAAIKSASLIGAQSQPYSNIRLFARDEWVLGRLEKQHSQADILLSPHGSNAAENASLSRRISARHAIIRRNAGLADSLPTITDISRYGILLDGISPEKDQPHALQAGMQIEFCASFRGIVKLQVLAIQPHLIILGDVDAVAGSQLIYLLQTETRPLAKSTPNLPLPDIFHFHHEFWHRDALTAKETRLDAQADLRGMSLLPPACRYSSLAYPDLPDTGASWRNLA